jgi:rare lipoprotein A
MKIVRLVVPCALLGLMFVGCAEEEPAPLDEPLALEQAPVVATQPAASVEAPVPDPMRAVLESEAGEATFYADMLDRKRTASGELLDQSAMVAAHRRYPFGTILEVTNLRNERSVEVRFIDRGPFGAPKVAKKKIIDLSRRAAEKLGIIDEGRAVVQVDVLEYGDGLEG